MSQFYRPKEDPIAARAQMSDNPLYGGYAAKFGSGPRGWNPATRQFDNQNFQNRPNPALDAAFEEVGKGMGPAIGGASIDPGRDPSMMPMARPSAPGAPGAPVRVSPGMYRMPDGSIQATPGGQAPQMNPMPRPAPPAGKFGEPKDPFGLDGDRVKRYLKDNPGKKKGLKKQGKM